MSDRPTPVATFDHPHEARFLAVRLEAEGLLVTLQDESASGLSMGPEAGGVKVLVPASSSDRVRALLATSSLAPGAG